MNKDHKMQGRKTLQSYLMAIILISSLVITSPLMAQKSNLTGGLRDSLPFTFSFSENDCHDGFGATQTYAEPSASIFFDENYQLYHSAHYQRQRQDDHQKSDYRHLYRTSSISGKSDLKMSHTWIVNQQKPADFSSIQDAIDMANPGDTIHVQAGIYFENIIINKSIILQGDGKETTIIDGGGFLDVIVILADHVLIQNLTLAHGWDGIDIRYASNVTIQSTIIMENEDGIDIRYNTSNIIIRNNTIQNNYYYGIGINHGQKFIIRDNIFRNNWWDGMNIRYSENNTIKKNQFISNKDYGVFLYCSKHISVTDNWFTGDGIVIKGPNQQYWDSHHIQNNTINDYQLYYIVHQTNRTIADDAGQIILVNCSNMQVENLVLRNTSISIQLGFSHDNVIRNCCISNSNDIGILLFNSDENIIHHNTIRNHSYTGISIDTGDQNVFFENQILNNDFYGIEMSYATNNQIDLNHINKNGYGGIYCYASTKNNMAANMIEENGIYGGICVNVMSNENTISENYFINNGLLVVHSYQNTVTDNLVNDNPLVYLEDTSEKTISGAGQVILINCSEITIQQCDIHNATLGIEIWNTRNSSCVKNDLSFHINMAIFCINSVGNEIIANTIYNNTFGINMVKASHAVVSSNILTNNAFDGVSLSQSDHCVVTKNWIEENDQYGILLENSSMNHLDNNQIIDCEIGIFLQSTSNKNCIKENSCTYQAVDGIGIIGQSCGNTLLSNICENNLKGISIRECDACFLDKNIASRNQQAILLNQVNSTIIANNTCTYNGVGIYLHQSKENEIKHNIIKYNNHKGIALQTRSNQNQVHHNQIGPWNYQGIYIERSRQNMITFNMIYQNNDDNIGLYLTYHNTINNNNILDATNYGIEGGLCFDDARNNYWGHRPTRWIRKQQQSDIITLGGFVCLYPSHRSMIPIQGINQS